MKKVKVPSDDRDKVSVIYKQIKKRDEFKKIPRDNAPPRLQATFAAIYDSDVDNFNENESWTPDCIGFRYQGLLNDYKARKNVFIHEAQLFDKHKDTSKDYFTRMEVSVGIRPKGVK